MNELQLPFLFRTNKLSFKYFDVVLLIIETAVNNIVPTDTARIIRANLKMFFLKYLILRIKKAILCILSNLALNIKLSFLT